MRFMARLFYTDRAAAVADCEVLGISVSEIVDGTRDEGAIVWVDGMPQKRKVVCSLVIEESALDKHVIELSYDDDETWTEGDD